MNFKELCQELESLIVRSYESSPTLEEAEQLSARFLHAQMIVSVELRKASLDVRMRKSGLKALKASVYLDEVNKSEKKPSDVLLNAIVDSSVVIQGEEARYNEAEEASNELQRYYDIFVNAHIFFRGVARGSFGG